MYNGDRALTSAGRSPGVEHHAGCHPPRHAVALPAGTEGAMSSSNGNRRRFALSLGSAALLALGVATQIPATARAKDEPPAAAKADAKSASPAKTADSVKENIKQLGKEVSDPGALQRIKAHEQELEKKIERKRDRQRKDHGQARPSDAVDLAKSLDKPEPAAGAPAKAGSKAETKSKAGATPAPAR
jgi:hypothetical protein